MRRHSDKEKIKKYQSASYYEEDESKMSSLVVSSDGRITSSKEKEKKRVERVRDFPVQAKEVIKKKLKMETPKMHYNIPEVSK